MDLYTIDFETHYSPEFSLSKLTTEEYVRDPQFETILVGIKKNDEPAYWVDGPWANIKIHLDLLALHDHAVLAHHAQFDGLIFNHHFGIRPKVWFDTLSMARAVRTGVKLGNSLAKLAEEYGLGVKGTEVVQALGKRRRDFSREDLRRYGEYCCNDCDLEHALFRILLPNFQRSELALIDRTIRMFTEPVLDLNAPLLQEYAEDIQRNKMTLLLEAGIQLADVMSNDLFAQALEQLGVDVPMKYSEKQKKLVPAFAKTDPGLQALAEHEDEAVQALVAARLENKTTINETRALRMASMQSRGPSCVYYNYYGAGVTGRFSGGDKMNWQNLPRGSKLRQAILAPPGHELVVADSSNIEARMLDWMAQQEDAVEAYRAYDTGRGPDIYCVMAERLYSRAVNKKDNPKERQDGKVIKLMSGYGAGGEKMVETVRVMTKRKIPLHTGIDWVNIYRRSHPAVIKFWGRCEEALFLILKGECDVAVDPRGIIKTCEGGLLLPNGMKIKYPKLEYHGKKNFQSEDLTGWTYYNGKSTVNLYGGKVVENIIQAVARIVVMQQLINVDEWPLVMTSHDEGVWCVPNDEVGFAVEEVNRALRTPLPWCLDLPLNCEVGHNQCYALAKS